MTSTVIPHDDTLLQPITTQQIRFFQERLLEWFEREGRHDLPWKPQESLSQKINLYRIWISEIMLQQTQVITVIPYFERFMTAFPTPEALACASEDEVLKLWQGLGYYSRARNLHHAAKQLVTNFKGLIPTDFEAIRSLKGIGDTTANAILAQGFNLPFAILDGNVRRVLSRITGMTAPRKELDKRLIPISRAFLCTQNSADYTQAIMDFGATLCTLSPACDRCFLQDYCNAFQHQKTTEIPAKAPKKKNSTESSVLLIFENEFGDILMEKRAESGIWGSLYSLPELLIKGRNKKSMSSPLLANATLDDYKQRLHIANLKHPFTHYTLEASIFKVVVMKNEILSQLEKADITDTYYFIPKDEILTLPTPKPIASVMENYLSPTDMVIS